MFKLIANFKCRPNSCLCSSGFCFNSRSIIISDAGYITNRKYYALPHPFVWNLSVISLANVHSYSSQSDGFRSASSASETKRINVYSSENELLQNLQNARRNHDAIKFSELLKDNVVASMKFSDNFVRALCQLLAPEWITLQSKYTLPRIMFSLGKYGYNCDSKERLKIYQNMLGKCNRLRYEFSPMAVSMIYSGCANANLKWVQLTATQQSDFQTLFLMVMKSTDARSMVASMHSLAKMGVKWMELESTFQTAIIARLLELHSDINDQGRSMIIYSLGEFRFDINTCDDKVKKMLSDISATTFLTKYDKTNKYFGQQQANTMLGLANMGFTASKMNTSLLGAIRNTLLNNIQFFDPQGLSNTLHSLSRMSVIWDDLPIAAKKNVIYTGSKLCLDMKSQELANTVYAMGIMGVNWASVSSPFRRAFETSFGRLQDRLIEQHVSNIIYGLGLMYAEWSTFTVPFHNAVQTALRRLCPSMNDQSIANTIYGFGEMNVRWGSLEPELQTDLLHACALQSRSFTSQGISNIVYGLDKMYTPWNEVSQKCLSRSIVMNCDRFTGQEISLVLLGLANMGASWDSLSLEMKHTFSKDIERLSESMNDQNIANSMYAIAVLSFDYIQQTSCPLLLRINNALISSATSRHFADTTHSRQILVFYETMKNINSSLKFTMSRFVKAMMQYEGDVPTSLHMNISQCLQQYFETINRHIVIENEFFGLQSRIFPVDCVVRQAGKIIAFIEIDGAHHYAADGITLDRIDQLKTHLYAQKYPGVLMLRIKNSDIYKNGMENTAVQLAEQILSVM